MFISTSVVQLVHAGTLQLDDTLAFWIPDLADRIDNAGSITLRHLVQHRSGVPDFDSQDGFSWTVAHTSTDDLPDFVLDRRGG